jgi:hypothetical protein
MIAKHLADDKATARFQYALHFKKHGIDIGKVMQPGGNGNGVERVIFVGKIRAVHFLEAYPIFFEIVSTFIKIFVGYVNADDFVVIFESIDKSSNKTPAARGDIEYFATGQFPQSFLKYIHISHLSVRISEPAGFHIGARLTTITLNNGSPKANNEIHPQYTDQYSRM